MKLGLIVEGHGDVESLPVLARRLAARVGVNALTVLSPFRVPRGKLVKEAELQRAVQYLSLRTSPGDAILVLLDADDDCPAQVGPRLLAWARAARADRRFSVVLANREYETWFLAAAESLRGHRTLPADLVAPADPEAVRGAKQWLSERMKHPYSETVDQAKLTAVFDLEAARRSPSFDKLIRDFETLFTP